MGIYEELHAQARELLPPDAYAYFATGSGVEETVAENEAAWHRWPLRPRIFRDVSAVDTATSVLGIPLPAPLGVAPTGYQRLAHPDGEIAALEGAADAGALSVVSTRATCGFDEIGPAAGPWWFQVYVLRDRDLTAAIVRGAVAAGARALVLTADTPYVGRKARPTPFPAGAPSGSVIPELAARDDRGTWQDPSVGPAEVGLLRELSDGLPVIVKGVLRADDARACVDAGASAVWVSNHGGRQLDGAISTAGALPEVVEAVGRECEVYVDGGVRTGRDVLRALALGARAVFLGRPVLWALSAGGADGVRDLLAAFRADLAEALALAGCARLDDVGPDLLGPTRQA